MESWGFPSTVQHYVVSSLIILDDHSAVPVGRAGNGGFLAQVWEEHAMIAAGEVDAMHLVCRRFGWACDAHRFDTFFLFLSLPFVSFARLGPHEVVSGRCKG